MSICQRQSSKSGTGLELAHDPIVLAQTSTVSPTVNNSARLPLTAALHVLPSILACSRQINDYDQSSFPITFFAFVLACRSSSSGVGRVVTSALLSMSSSLCIIASGSGMIRCRGIGSICDSSRGPSPRTLRAMQCVFISVVNHWCETHTGDSDWVREIAYGSRPTRAARLD